MKLTRRNFLVGSCAMVAGGELLAASEAHRNAKIVFYYEKPGNFWRK